MRLTIIEFSFDPCNVYRDGPRGVGYPADARSVGGSHPSCFCLKAFKKYEVLAGSYKSQKQTEKPKVEVDKAVGMCI